jgi:hypothetical protein
VQLAWEFVHFSEESPDNVWEILTHTERWRRWSRWTKSELERSGEFDAHGVGSLRRLGLGPFSVRDEVVEFDAPKHIAFQQRTRPAGLTSYRTDVYLERDEFGTKVTWCTELTPAQVGWMPNAYAALLRAVQRDTGARLVRAVDELAQKRVYRPTVSVHALASPCC